ncbi:MAG: hypothetical protein RLZZ488_2267 [Pseudomonadota bacterium]|jgi:hypothetical protein
MDLMKLLKAKTEHLLARHPKNEYSYCEKILADLKLQFDAFLRDIAKLDEFSKRNPLEGIKAVSGDVLIEDEYGVLGKSPYFFLRIPGHPGLLLEPAEDETLVLVAATEARPFQRQWNGEVTSQVVFVRKLNPLANFRVLESDVVRNLNSGKTMSAAQFFEHLVETLILHIENAST